MAVALNSDDANMTRIGVRAFLSMGLRRGHAAGAALLLVAAYVTSMAHAADGVSLYAAGSLRDALTEIARAFEAAGGPAVRTKFGPSGLLKDEIAAGAPADVFASANMEHPQALAASGKGTPVILFTRNRLCALARPGLAVTPASLADVMLDANVKLGTSTPRADPSGDYAWEIFRRVDADRPGAFATLESKALQLVGGAVPTSPSSTRSPYVDFIAEGKADLFLAYCTSAVAAQKDMPGVQIVQLPAKLAVGAAYGLTVMKTAPPAAAEFALFVMSVEGQRTLAKHGFTAPALPQN